MAQRLRLFVKKRGQRRTGSRWFGTLGVAVLDLGAGGDRRGRPLLAARARAAGRGRDARLVAWLGAGDPDRADRSTASTDWPCSSGETSLRPSGGPRSCKWPPTGTCRDQPRARPARRCRPCRRSTRSSIAPACGSAYRLPSDAASGQLSFALAVVCVVWNSLVAGFVIQVVRQHLAGPARIGCSPG